MSEETIKDKCIIVQKRNMYAGFSVRMQTTGPWSDSAQGAVDNMEEWMPIEFDWELKEVDDA